MELIKRYVAAVQRELPENKRADIGRELEANIYDQLDALSEKHEVTEQQVSDILKQLGHPSEVAMQFSPPTPLISAKNMPIYLHVLVVTLGVVFVIQLIGVTGRMLDSESFGILRYVISIAANFIDHAVAAFTVVTLIFAAITASEVGQPETEQHKNWDPLKLPKIDDDWGYLSLQDIFTDIASYAFLITIILYPIAFGTQENTLLTDRAATILIYFSPVIILGILLSLWQLRMRVWNSSMLALSVIVNGCFFVVMVYLALTGPILESSGFYAWSTIIDTESFQRSFNITLLIIALSPGYECIRDLRRYLSSKRSNAVASISK